MDEYKEITNCIMSQRELQFPRSFNISRRFICQENSGYGTMDSMW